MILRSIAQLLALLALLLISLEVAVAQSSSFTYQGQLQDGGNPANGSYDLQFRLFDALVSGGQIGSTQVVENVAVAAGIFTVSIDFGAASFPGADRFLEIAVRPGASAGAFTALTPLQKVATTPYALQSLNATTAQALTPPVYIQQNSGSPTIFAVNNGSGGYALRAETSNSTGRGLVAQTTSTTGSAIAVSGDGYGDTGTGVLGFARNNTGVNVGVAGYTNSPSGYGVAGYNGAIAVRGETFSPGSYGVSGRGEVIGVVGTTASSGTGVSGTSTTGNGVQGTSTSGHGVSGTSASGRGVSGNATGSGIGVFGTGATGVRGESPSTTGFGVAGVNNGGGSSISWGVYGQNTSTGGYAIEGYNPNGIGVRGNGGIYAGQFLGNVQVQGTLTKTSGTFQIDHPLDPANKYLFHSFVESPDMKNIYDGIATLDENGEAWVELPAYFEALNRDFRYQLTALGSRAPDLFIAEQIAHNRFRIAGGSPQQQISWQVTGTRKDAYAEAHPVQVEVDKPEAERGKYLYPELYGQPASQAIVTPTRPPVGIADQTRK